MTSKRSKPHPPHTGGTLHCWLQPLYTEKTHCFVLRLPPQKQAPRNTHAAIRMRFAAPRAHPCSHYNAICIHSLQNTEEEEPIGFETIQTAPAAHRRYPSSPAAATLRFALRLRPQNQPHATFMQPLQCDLHPIIDHDNNHAAIKRVYFYVMSSLTPQSHTTLH